MNMDERIKRINELYHKSQNEGLSTLSIHLATVLKVCYTFTKLKMDTKFIHIDTEERKWK